MVLKKGKSDNRTLFIDASKECIKVTNNNKLTAENIKHIVDVFSSRENEKYFSHLASYDEIVRSEYNLTVSRFVEPEDTREKIDIVKLNQSIQTIVERQQSYRKEILSIVENIESGTETRLSQLLRELCPEGVEYKELREIATVSRGGNFQKKDFIDTGYPCVHYGQIYTSYGLFADKTLTFINESCYKKQKFASKNDIVMAVTSENIEDVCKCIGWLGDEKIAVSGHSAIIHHNQNVRYLVYYFHSEAFFTQKRLLAHGTKVIEVTPDKLLDIKIPVPPLEVQDEIVRILDDYTRLTEKLTMELTAELTESRKQYEYYRDSIMNFENV